MTLAMQVTPAARRAERRQRSRAFQSYAAIVMFILLTAAMVLVHAGSVLNFAFPLLAACLAGALFIYRRSAYLAFTWWIWLASPEVRRLVDYQTSFHSISPVMVAPLLVTAFAVLAVIRRPQILLRSTMLPFGLLTFVILLALIIGVLNNGFLSAAFDLANWLEPLAFGILLIMDTRGAQENRDALMSAIIIGLIVIGAYGIYQFFHLPAWDAFWLNESRLTSAGAAYAEQVRIFGPLNGPGSYGVALAGSLVFMLVAKGPLKIAAGAAGFPALALCGVRSAWGILAVAAIMVFWRMSGKSRIRIAIAAVIVAAVAAPVLTVGPVASLVTERFSSISNIKQDQSANDREKLYSRFVITSLTQPIGVGLGALGTANKLNTGVTADFDSGILEIPFVFGWVGGLLFIWSMVRISLSVLGSYLKTKEPITNASAAMFFGMLAGLIFGQVFVGSSGIMVWTAIGLVLSSPAVSSNRVRPRLV